MWLFQDTDPFAPLEKTGEGALNFAKNVEAAMLKAFDTNRIEKFFLKLEDDAKSLNTKIGNGLQANLKNIESTIFEVYKEGLDYGFAYEDAGKFIDTIGTSAEKLININKENVMQALKLSKAMGVSAEEVGKMYSNIMKMGMGQQKANEILEKTFKAARAYGVDASKLADTVSQNILKSQAYGFKDGVEGLTKMAIQAQRVGVSMDMAASAADKAFSPEGAIEMASNLQMLGGNMGGLTDFHSLMYMAQSDTGALQDQILKTTSSMVDFNSKSGEFKINPQMRMNLTQYAESIGSTYDKVAEGAIKFRKEQEIMSRIPISAGFSEEDKSFLAGMGEIGKGGKVEIQDPKTGELIDATSLAPKELKALRDKYDEANKPVEQVAREQLSVQDKMAKTLEEIRNAGIFGMGVDRGIKIPETIDTQLIGIAQNFATTLKTEIGGSTLPDVLIKTYSTTLETLNSVITEFTENVKTLISDAETNLRSRAKERLPEPTPAEDLFVPAGGNTVVKGSFGSFVGDKRDSTLLMPENDMESLFSTYNLINKMSSDFVKPLPMKEISKSEPIEKYVENKITTENKITNEVNIGGKSELEIILKTPNNDSEKILSLLLNNSELKETVMATINERLSKEYSEQLVNVLARG